MIKCPKHGKIRGRTKGSFCPVCGEETISLNVFPLLKIYIDKEWLYDIGRLSIKIAFSCLAIWLIWYSVTGVSGCLSRENIESEKAAQIKKDMIAQDQTIASSMEPAWASLYNSLALTERDSYKIEIIRKFISNEELKKTSKITSQQIKIIMRLFDEDFYKKEAMDELYQFVEINEVKH